MQQRNEKFIVANRIRNLILEVEEILIYFPRKEYHFKDHLISDCYDLLHLVYLANYAEERTDLQTQLLAKISMIDFYFEKSYKNKYISEKQFGKLVNQLTNITRLVYGWIAHETS